MRIVALVAALQAAVSVGLAEPAKLAAHAHANHAAAPRSVGKFGDWQVAIHQEAGAPVCYAFARAQASSTPVPGRGDVVLTVTQRPRAHISVAISAGYPIPGRTDATVQVGAQKLLFYIAGRFAFARDGKTALASFAAAGRAVAKFPAPKGGEVTDFFGLKGFSAAMSALSKACVTS